MESPTDYNIRNYYNTLCKHVASQETITDDHARNMAALAATSALDSFKIWFRDDLKRLGLETRLSWSLTNETVEV